jgi:hypothetical protein
MNMIVIVTVMVVIDMYDLILYYESLIAKLNKKTDYNFIFNMIILYLRDRQY